MKMLFKKAICLLSSAVLLCGASAIPASADTTSAYNPSASSRPSTTTTADTGRSSGRVGRLKYYLDTSDFDLAKGEIKYVTIKKSSGYTVPANSTVSYQWYRDDTAIKGATNVSYPVKTAGTYYCKVTVKTAHVLKGGRTGKTTTRYTFDEYDTDKIKVYAQLVIDTQPDICYIDENTGVATVYVFPYGGHGSNTYEWTNYGSKLSKSSNIIGVTEMGFYVCTVTDSVGNTATSKPIQVKYTDVKINSYTENILFDRAFGTAQTAKIKIKASGGSGTYTYFLQKKGKNNEWYDVTYSYTPEFELKFEDINDNYQYINQKPYYRDGKWHYWGTSRNTNYYRVYVRSYGNWGVIAGSATTGEITVIRENGQEDSFTSDYFYY